MIKYILRTLLLGSATIFGIILLIFIMIQLAPGNPIDTIAPKAPPEIRDQIISMYGLDKAFHIQFAHWVVRMLHGDLGTSYIHGRAVVDILRERIPPTARLIFFSYLVSLCIALPLGMHMGLPKRKYSNTYMYLSFDAVGSMPDFWIARLLIVFLAVELRWFPVSSCGVTGIEAISIWEKLQFMLSQVTLPAIALGLGNGRVSLFARHTREEIESAISNNYIDLAIAKGIGKSRVLWNHALPNSLVPLLTQIVASIPSFIGATIVVEMMFAYPGLGFLIYRASINHDYPLILGATLVLGIVVTVLNVFHDLILYALDPQARR